VERLGRPGAGKGSRECRDEGVVRRRLELLEKPEKLLKAREGVEGGKGGECCEATETLDG